MDAKMLLATMEWPTWKQSLLQSLDQLNHYRTNGGKVDVIAIQDCDSLKPTAYQLLKEQLTRDEPSVNLLHCTQSYIEVNDRVTRRFIVKAYDSTFSEIEGRLDAIVKMLPFRLLELDSREFEQPVINGVLIHDKRIQNWLDLVTAVGLKNILQCAFRLTRTYLMDHPYGAFALLGGDSNELLDSIGAEDIEQGRKMDSGWRVEFDLVSASIDVIAFLLKHWSDEKPVPSAKTELELLERQWTEHQLRGGNKADFGNLPDGRSKYNRLDTLRRKSKDQNV